MIILLFISSVGLLTSFLVYMVIVLGVFSARQFFLNISRSFICFIKNSFLNFFIIICSFSIFINYFENSVYFWMWFAIAYFLIFSFLLSNYFCQTVLLYDAFIWSVFCNFSNEVLVLRGLLGGFFLL